MTLFRRGAVPHQDQAPSFLIHLSSLMAAAQIPNLNTLRTGRSSRGRGNGRTGENGLGSRPSGKDRVVQGTDNDASVSRLSAVELGYLEDPYATALMPSGSATRRLPIINRGRLLFLRFWGRSLTRACYQGHMFAPPPSTNSSPVSSVHTRQRPRKQRNRLSR